MAFAAIALALLEKDSFAQTKVGYIDSKKIMDNIQEAKDAKMKLDNIVSDWQKELNSLQDSLKKVKDDFEKKKAYTYRPDETSKRKGNLRSG